MEKKYCKKCGKRLYRRKKLNGTFIWKHKHKLGQGFAYGTYC